MVAARGNGPAGGGPTAAGSGGGVSVVMVPVLVMVMVCLRKACCGRSRVRCKAGGRVLAEVSWARGRREYGCLERRCRCCLEV